MEPFYTWIQQFLAWLGRLFNREEAALQVLEEYVADGTILLRLQHDGIPGLVDLWRIDRCDCYPRKFFIAIFNVAHLKYELGQHGGSYRVDPQFHKLANKVQTQLENQDSILATHYWVSGWVGLTWSIGKGTARQVSEIRNISVIACDLQGVSASIAGDRYALRIARKIAFRLAQDIDSCEQPLKYNSWEEIVQGINWIEWLTGYAQSRGGIHPEHILQPQCPKPKPRNPRFTPP